MAQGVKVLAATSDPRAHKVGEKNELQKVVLKPPHAHCGMCIHTHAHTNLVKPQRKVYCDPESLTQQLAVLWKLTSSPLSPPGAPPAEAWSCSSILWVCPTMVRC